MSIRYCQISILVVALAQSVLGGMTYEQFRSSLHSSSYTNDVPLIGYTLWSISRVPSISVALVKNVDPNASDETMQNLRGLAVTRATNVVESLSFVDDPPQAQKHIFLHVIDGTREEPILLLIARFGRALTTDEREERNRARTVAENFKAWFVTFALPEIGLNEKTEEELP